MTEGTSRVQTRPGLAGYFSRHARELVREVKQLLVDADRDTDVASMTVLSQGPRGDNLRADGAIIVIKGGNYVELFAQWAERNRLITRGKPIVSDAIEGETDDV